MTTRHGFFSHAFLLLVLSIGLGLAGCEGDDGADGVDGIAGTNGADGADGISCWDLNENGIGDPDEDLNGDGVVNVTDCNAIASGAYEAAQLHAGWFATNPYEGTESCLACHGKLAEDVLETAHFTWQGVASNIEGREGFIHGKRDIMNNFCIAVPSNEGRCTQCHAGYGWADQTFDFGDTANIDCLVCHDQTFDENTLLGTYVKAKPAAGLPEEGVDLNLVAQSVAMGSPTIRNCIRCHANAGGGDNVKHGDLAMSLKNTTREYDVHMGTTDSGGLGYQCIKCHEAEDHGIGGMPYHSVDEGNMQGCEDCHQGGAASVHAGLSVEGILQSHTRLACQTCHIPAFARQTSTKTEWYWERAGQVIDPVPVDPVTGRPTFDRKKGDFVWALNVRPTLRFFNGKWDKVIINVNDTYDVDEGTPENPVVLGAPVGDCGNPDDMIYPFKKMIGNQPADVVNRRILVPHLFGSAGGPNAFWGNWDWDGALLDAAAITGQPYQAGDFGFVDTAMYLAVNHEIAPQEEALGFGGAAACGDCHFAGGIDWTELGYTGDPVDGGVCP